MSTPQYRAPPPQHQSEELAPVSINTLAVAAFASSFLIGVTGIIFGFIALNQIKTTGERGRGLAITAIVVGCACMASNRDAACSLSLA